jgi:hypothetical protein
MRMVVSLFFAALNLTLVRFPSSTQELGKNPQGNNDIRVRVETPGALYLTTLSVMHSVTLIREQHEWPLSKMAFTSI